MTANTRMYWLHTISPLHVGSGRGVGFIDLPIAREKVTGWPLVPGTAVKGVLADNYGASVKARETEGVNRDLFRTAFGVAGDEHSNSGSLVFSDARLVCLPVRSLYGTFAWLTSPLALRRLIRDLEACGGSAGFQVPEGLAAQQLYVPQDIASALVDTATGKVYLEDLDFTAQANAATKTWAETIAKWLFPDDAEWAAEFSKRFAVVPDDSFNFLSETGTEVNARVRIDPDKKTVMKGALWYEESLPAESVLAGLIWCDRLYGAGGTTQQELLTRFCTSAVNLQVGGKATVGKGRVRCLFSPKG